MLRLAAITCLAVLAAIGCGSDRATRGEDTLDVVATVSPVADVVRNVGGRRVDVTTLVARGVDPHRFSPDAGHREAMRRADMVVRAGGRIDDWAAGVEAEREIVLLPRVDPLAGDPHWWLDPVRVQHAAKEARNELARADVHGAGYYEAATADYLERLRRLHRHIRACAGRLPTRHPRLATRHGGLAYFADRYGLRIVAAQRRSQTIDRRLWVDTLAPPGADADSYLGAMAENAGTIVEAVSDGSETCRPNP